MTDAAADTPPDRPPEPRPALAPAIAVACGVIISLCVTGYTFMQSNQQVYLLDALRAVRPETMARDWFVTNTLQYHVIYTQLTVALKQLDILWAGCFALHLMTVVTLHVAWRSIVRSLGGDDRRYFLSVVLYHLSAGGLGLGVYQFLQDGGFLASNVASVATLGGLAFWLRDRRYWAAVCVGLAGAFHVNYALLLGFAWAVFTLLALIRRPRPIDVKTYVLTSLIAMAPCVANLAGPLLGAMRQHDEIPLSQFVPLYIELRHPHHFDARHWPLGLWLSFLWPIPFALEALRRMPAGAPRTRVRDVLLLVLAIQVVGTLFAGVWVVSETLVKMSLFRVSIFAKLLTCVLTAKLIADARPTRRTAVAGALVVIGLAALLFIPWRSRTNVSIPTPSAGMLACAGLMSLAAGIDLERRVTRAVWTVVAAIGLPLSLWLASQQRLGPAMPGESDPPMAELCDWVRGNTPPRALFLVPPHDSMFRLRAERATVISFKHVPQLSGEFVEWKRRLDDVLGVDILTLSRPMYRTLADMADRYRDESPERLALVARSYECDYLVAMRDLGPAWSDRLVHATPAAGASERNYWLYRMSP